MTNTTPPSSPGRAAIWKLIRPFWASEQKWKAFGLLLAIIALNLGMVYINVRLNSWNRDMYDVLQARNYPQFKSLLWQFSGLAFVFIAVAIYSVYLTQALQIRWRYWMTERYMDRWLAHRAYYRIEQGQQGRLSDNPDQRIAEDLRALTSDTLSLVLGFISSSVTLLSFVHILWAVSGPAAFSVLGQAWNIPGYMVWFAVAYAAAGSAIVWWIGRPLVGLNFNQERFEANFRFGLIRVREHSEAVALYRGEAQERAQLTARLDDIRGNWWDIMRVTKKLNIAVNFYSQFAVIFPMLVSAPRYFSGAISLGVLMQISNAFGQVQDALSWFINAFTTLASWKASINRLAGFNADVERAQGMARTIEVERHAGSALTIEGLQLSLPDGGMVLRGMDARLESGEHVLVSGPSGCGKSTLIRAIADVWPYGRGRIGLPAGAAVMFLPQRSYLPIGTLRAALSYPAAEGSFDDATIARYLALCRLPQLAGRLDQAANWSHALSPGEQQRLAFVRVFLNRPALVFLDEASSAMDGETEEALYAALPRELPGVTVVSIAHRETLARFHSLRWRFVPAGEGEGCRVEVAAL
ncbi:MULTISPECIES: ABC transporter ATP-binding protein/permease [unclassified Herbaspirillum]|uniref:ABC transporter ATP-binding protein/permease n=1 Tax=unclassified Herbaspirillum TaxID=2624150 RepID=UPI0011505A04|nr:MULTISPECIES: ABC transporter ATP-binding protein/permease [unclassified Herbaspirillum]MBB5393955.1 putative ATP-binding cassette transporter [Herbaspirillum sp. SJZ102]TQK00009.1 putative ATP-binding cassette transporter [Herbaspirillum sp. SJZ130]TQK04667.1 putative ATP-binding cassette transporter [Herbaspirillum sp. SJZ106]TWC63216.1 putative ATP-binding cassette transporter [Herbaspirillum sp. SJZ099]